MSNHEGVTCDNCMTTAFTGQRFKCLICFDYDLCHECYVAGAFSTNHLPSHSMQCILTRHQLEILLAGESNGHIIQSFQCPFCQDLGFNTHLLETHVRNKHKDKVSVEVMCPICAVSSSSEANRVVRDLPQHILATHKKPVVDMYEEEIGLGAGSLRQIRRVNNPSSRGAMNSQRMRTNLQTMNFNEQNKESLSELLSQLSVTRGVRTQAANVTGISSHLQHLESQLTTTRQHLERLRTLNVDFSMREAIFSQLPPPSSKPPKLAVLNGVIVNDSGASLSSGISEVQRFPAEAPATTHTPNHQHKSANPRGASVAGGGERSDRFLLSNYKFSTDHSKSGDADDDDEAAILKSKRSLFAHELTMSVIALQNKPSSSSLSSSSSSIFSNPSPLHPSEETCSYASKSLNNNLKLSPKTQPQSSQPPPTQPPPQSSSSSNLTTSSQTQLFEQSYEDSVNSIQKTATTKTTISAATTVATSSMRTLNNSITSTTTTTPVTTTKSVNFTATTTNPTRSYNIMSTTTILTTTITSIPVTINTATTSPTTLPNAQTIQATTEISVATETSIATSTTTTTNRYQNVSSNNNNNNNNTNDISS